MFMFFYIELPYLLLTCYFYSFVLNLLHGAKQNNTDPSFIQLSQSLADGLLFSKTDNPWEFGA